MWLLENILNEKVACLAVRWWIWFSLSSEFYYSVPKMGWITLRTVHVSLCFHSQCIGMPGQATSDFQLMKAVAKETRLDPLVRQQHLARLADDFQRYGDISTSRCSTKSLCWCLLSRIISHLYWAPSMCQAVWWHSLWIATFNLFITPMK